MINRKTVFVLGAGASLPYGLISGAQLRRDICQIAANPPAYPAGMAVLAHGEVGVSEFQNFGHAFARSSIASIDTFLSKRGEFARMGKLAIAAVLCGYEKADRLFNDAIDDHWYKLLWNAMLQDTASAPDVSRNSVRFVSFNYDRSLEEFLFEATMHTWGLSASNCAAIVAKIPIVHVYGLLGRFTKEPKGGFRTYGEELSKEGLKLAAEEIHVIPEHREDKVFVEVRKWFGWAERICFLGFGFDPLNVGRLGLHSVMSWTRQSAAPVPTVYATRLGRSDVEHHSDRVRLLGEAEHWISFSSDCSHLLRNTPLLIE